MNYQEIINARQAAHKKHGENSIEATPAESAKWLPILGEEFGEVAGTLTYDKNVADLRSELIDLIAVASAWVDAIDGENL
jgi:NTP pyrophosphatase (non-canonical NTP hydrolase)